MRALSDSGQADVVLVAPAAAGRLSGGFLVNEELLETGVVAAAVAHGPAELERTLSRIGARHTILADSIYLFDEPSAVALARAALGQRIVLLAHSLPSLIPHRPIDERRRFLAREREVLAAAHGAVAPGSFLASALVRRGLARDRVSVVPPAPIVDGRRAKREDRAPSGPLEILTVANWSGAKGFFDAARALCLLPHIDWRWSIVGSRDGAGELARRVDSLIAEHGLSDRVTIAGPVEPDALAGRYARADIFLLPSLMESYGLAFAEALTYGVPVVGYRCAEVPSVVGAAGRLCRAGSHAALAESIEALASDRRVLLDALRRTARDVSHALPDRSGFRRAFADAVDRLGRLHPTFLRSGPREASR
ncbi:MAG: glycosyltransferase family 4 protein [Spirochaetota bacterium]